MFQSTRPRGARRLFPFSCMIFSAFQSTRPRGARRLTARSNDTMPRVSIHAPARGATPIMPALRVSSVFQSTRPRGARRLTARFFGSWPCVSIHAPARGATVGQFDPTHRCVMFQSTRPRGARQQDAVDCGGHRSFNPRAREGRDFFCSVFSKNAARFNPRAREGRDGCQFPPA